MRSLHMRLVLILTVLIVALMAVVGFFLIDAVSLFYRDEFANQMLATIDIDGNESFMPALQIRAEGPSASAVPLMEEYIESYAAPIGLDGDRRKYFILDGATGKRLGGNEPGTDGVALTPNILRAMQGNPGDEFSASGDFFDCAVPVFSADGNFYILYIIDNKQSLQRLTTELFIIVLQAVLLGLVIAILLSFVLSKTLSMPIENLTHSAAKVASGDFSHPPEVHSRDEIGVLTETFNDMSRVLKETIETLESERDKLGTLFLYMTDGVVSFSGEGVLLHMNPAAIRLLSIEQAEDMSYDDILGQIMPMSEMLSLKAPGYAERELAVGDRSLQILFAPFGAESGENGIVAVIRDITEQQRLDRLRREFVSNVSHELRTPLTNVKSYAETLAENAGELPEETVRGFSQVIVSEADRMTLLVRDLLTLSRFDYGKVDWRYEPFSFAATLQSIFNAIKIQGQQRGHEMSLTIPDDPLVITADASRIEQVVVNIISNAIHYTPDGGRIEVSAGRVAEEVWCRVKDNGIGIPKKEIPHLFERFYRVDKARSRSSGGTGLGLAIAQEIVAGHGGYIRVTSRPGEGSTFTVNLPVEPLPVRGDKT